MPKRKRSTRQDQRNLDDDEGKSAIKVESNTSLGEDVLGESRSVEQIVIQSNDKKILAERRGNDNKPALIFTHGAGGGLSNPATKDFADGFAEHSTIVSFQGTMNLQSRVRGFEAVIEHEKATTSALGGRSMGARAAVLTAQEFGNHHGALVLVSYPMVGAQKGDSREQILLDLPADRDVLFISGSRDSMCSIENLRRVRTMMKARAWIVEVEGADHGMGFKPKLAAETMRRLTGSIAAKWLGHRDSERRYCQVSWDDEAGEVLASDWERDKEEHGEVEASNEDKPARKRKRKQSL